MNDIALDMAHYRENKKQELVAKVASLKDPKADFIEALTASGASVTNFTLFNAQRRDALAASVAASDDCGCCKDGELTVHQDGSVERKPTV